ncbi:MAG: type II toxin-antitoxin system RelE/ParE family toxin [Planctomycetes bacterium]|nr:type II toxin-antitoxin system RelE/ParE family toxin [Planctomycetota bacterium]
MTYRIEVKPQPRKALARIPNPHRRRIARAIDALARNPRPPGCVKLAGAEAAYRIRIGDYRVVYEVADRVLIIYIIRVAHRKDVYRGL